MAKITVEEMKKAVALYKGALDDAVRELESGEPGLAARTMSTMALAVVDLTRSLHEAEEDA
jgi:hypothetical protein